MLKFLDVWPKLACTKVCKSERRVTDMLVIQNVYSRFYEMIFKKPEFLVFTFNKTSLLALLCLYNEE